MLTARDIEIYFAAEKQAGLIFIIVGSAAVITGLMSYFIYKTPFYKGVAIPLIVIGLVQVAAGTTVHRRSDSDSLRNIHALNANPSQLREKELPRMLNVNQNFQYLKWIEIALALCGLALILVLRKKSNLSFWRGIGLTLALQALLILFADIAAEKRAHIYTKKLVSFVNAKATANLYDR